MNDQGPIEGLLSPLEQSVLRGNYSEYYTAKRNNFLANIQRYSQVWSLFLDLDGIWHRAILDLQRPTSGSDLLPIALFTKSHAQTRVSFELGFSGCITDAMLSMRVGIEAASHARKLVGNSEMAYIWSARNKGEADQKIYRKEFEEKKKEKLFGQTVELRELYHYWKMFSEWAAHSNVRAFSKEMNINENDDVFQLKYNYLVTNDLFVRTALLLLFRSSRLMETLFFDAYEERLSLDYKLMQERETCSQKSSEMYRSMKENMAVPNDLRDEDEF